MRAAWVLVVLAGCRLGFDRVSPGDAGDDSAGDTVELRVVTDEYGNDARGLPIAGATVLVDHGHGLERSTTGADGAAHIAVADLAAIHVAFHGDLGWRIYTVIAPPAGVIELGGRPGAQVGRAVLIQMPDISAIEYTARVAEHCAAPPGNAGRVAALDLAAECEGQAHHVLGFATPVDSGDLSVYLDGGQVTLNAGATRTLTGTFRVMPPYVFNLTHLPATATSAGVQLVERTELDILPLTPTLAFATVPPGSAQLTAVAAPGGNAVALTLSNTTTPRPYLSNSDSILPVVAASPITIDTASLVAPFGSLVLTAPPSVAWTGAAGGTLAIVETITGEVQWDAYLPASATSVAFPALPADLGVPTPTRFDVASALKLSVPGATRASLQATIDRTWPQWPHDDSLLPEGGSTLARILYSASLGPP